MLSITFLFTPAVRLASLPFPFLIPLQAMRRVFFVPQSVLHMAYRVANLQLEVTSDNRFIKEYANSTTAHVGGTQNARPGQESKPPCYAVLRKRHSLFLSVLVFFYLVLKMRICSVCCCVIIKYIFIVFQTYIHIYKCYIYIYNVNAWTYVQ